jgi:Sulfotransferase family
MEALLGRLKPILLEKSPPNLIRTRFFAALFPGSLFVMIVRHPVAVAYATRKWNRAPLAKHLRHWLRAHRLLADDLPYLDHVIVVRYEEFVLEPQHASDRIWRELGLGSSPAGATVRPDGNNRYFERWQHAPHPFRRCHRSVLARQFESSFGDFGYSLRDLEFVGPAGALDRARAA